MLTEKKQTFSRSTIYPYPERYHTYSRRRPIVYFHVNQFPFNFLILSHNPQQTLYFLLDFTIKLQEIYIQKQQGFFIAMSILF